MKDKPNNRLREFREKHRLKQCDIANMLGVHESAVSIAENSRTTALGLEKWFLLADYFDVDPRELMGRKSEKLPAMVPR